MRTFILHGLPQPVFLTVDLRHNSRSFQLSFACGSYPETVLGRPNCFPTTSAIKTIDDEKRVEGVNLLFDEKDGVRRLLKVVAGASPRGLLLERPSCAYTFK
jgi:hypothetical protein